jgi:hypothetical protein
MGQQLRALILCATTLAQGLAAVPHFHLDVFDGRGLAAAAPHVHLGHPHAAGRDAHAHAHHGHGHAHRKQSGLAAALCRPCGDHDDDALYLQSDAVIGRHASLPVSALAGCGSALCCTNIAAIDASRAVEQHCHGPPRPSSAECPLYLTTLSLRI